MSARFDDLACVFAGTEAMLTAMAGMRIVCTQKKTVRFPNPIKALFCLKPVTDIFLNDT